MVRQDLLLLVLWFMLAVNRDIRESLSPGPSSRLAVLHCTFHTRLARPWLSYGISSRLPILVYSRVDSMLFRSCNCGASSGASGSGSSFPTCSNLDISKLKDSIPPQLPPLPPTVTSTYPNGLPPPPTIAATDNDPTFNTCDLFLLIV